MKKLLLASVIAVLSAVAVAAPANAASITLGIGNGYDDDYYAPRYRHHYRDYSDDDGYYRRYGMYDNGYRHDNGRYHHRCHMETVTHWRGHHRVLERVEVCRR